MDEALLARCVYLSDSFSERQARGQTLTEDEVLAYNQILNLIRVVCRMSELHHQLRVTELEKELWKDDDGNSNGVSATGN